MGESEVPQNGLPNAPRWRQGCSPPGSVVCTSSRPGSMCWLCWCHLLLTDHLWLPIAFIPKPAFLQTSVTRPPSTTVTPKCTLFSRTGPPITTTPTSSLFGRLLVSATSPIASISPGPRCVQGPTPCPAPPQKLCPFPLWWLLTRHFQIPGALSIASLAMLVPHGLLR